MKKLLKCNSELSATWKQRMC